MAKKRKTTPSKRRPPQKHPPKPLKRRYRFAWVFAGIFVLVGLGFYIGSHQKQLRTQAGAYLDRAARELKATPKTSSHKPSVSVTKKSAALELLQYGQMEDAQSEEEMPDISWYEPGKTEQTSVKTPKKSSVKNATKPLNKPRLAIIIDDVAHADQLKRIRALPFPVTPSIFPPSEISTRTPDLARNLKHFMIHLPLESGSKAMNRMRGMLFVHDSAARMQKRVDAIRKWFPSARYINNHTGSVFTSDYRAMKRLYGMLRKAGFRFVDSRTTARSTLKRITREYGDRYIARNVFIDNKQNVRAILGQLKKAASYARKHGRAIVIGHPHDSTFAALERAQKLFGGIDLVYIDELYR
jgi:polysaccharide deacetylase 2 family uncharacterized protein YibQ